MKNMKFWRTALVATLVLTVMLSVTGGTIAWFTDTVESNSNIIKSGNLDVAMQWADGTEAVPADASDDWTDASTGAIFDYDLWEPGYVEARHVAISNVGSLALKYKLTIKPEGTVSELANVIDVYYFDSAEQLTSRSQLTEDKKIGTLADVIANNASAKNTAAGNLLVGENHTVTIALKMQESAGNEYQNKSIGTNFALVLEAIQLTYEEDSFGDDYDANAPFKEVVEEAAIANNSGKLGEAVVLTGNMDYGQIKVTVPVGAQLSSADVESLKLTVKDAANGYNGQLTEMQVATGYEIYVEGIADYIHPFVNASGRSIYNYSDITVELPIGVGRNDVKVYKDGMMPNTTWASYDSATGVVTFSTEYFTPFSNPKKSNFTVVYTELSEAEEQLNEALENASAGDSVSISSTADNMVSVNNIADALNGSFGIKLVGEGADNTTVASNGATVTADSLTVKDMTILSVGTTTIKGDNTTIEGVTYQSVGASYGLTVSGSDTTITGTTVEGANATQGLLLIESNSDTTASVTNVSGLTITDTSPFGASSGFTFKNINGTVNLSNSTIKVGGAAFGFGPSNSNVRGYVNVSNTTFDSTSASISTVKASTFDTVVFENTWSDSAIRFTVGGTTNTFTNCEFNADVDFQSANYANKNVTLTFDNCKYNGAAITEDNIGDHFVFNNGTFGLQNRDNLTVIVNDKTVTLD